MRNISTITSKARAFIPLAFILSCTCAFIIGSILPVLNYQKPAHLTRSLHQAEAAPRT